MYSVADTCLAASGFPHSEMFGSMLVCQLPEPYRRLPRLSSPLTAKASTMCTYSLDYITPNSPLPETYQSYFVRLKRLPSVA